MAELRRIYFERGSGKQTQYALMKREGNVWAVFQAIWAGDDDTAAKKGAVLVENIQDMMPQYKHSVFTVMKMIATNGTEDM